MASASVLSNGQNSERDFSLGLPQEQPKPAMAATPSPPPPDVAPELPAPDEPAAPPPDEGGQ